MDFRWLKTFLIASKYENFRQTAEMLYISQPTVTFHIKQLEDELGMKLFERVGRNIHLTAEGEQFKIFAQQLVELYENSLSELQTFKQGYQHRLTIAISPLIADTILPSVLKKFLKAYPEVEINIRVTESTYIEELLLNNEVDLGISCLPSFNRKLHVSKLYDDDILFVVPHDGQDLETGLPIDEEESLRKYHLFTDSHPAIWEKLLPVIKNNFPFVKTLKVSEVHITKRFITEGLGVSYLPASTIRRELLEGRLIVVPSSLPLPKTSTYFIIRYENTLILKLLEYIKQFRF